MNSNELPVMVEIRDETPAERERYREEAVSAARDRPNIYVSTVLAHAYKTAEQMQENSAETAAAILKAFPESSDPGADFVQREFIELLRIGGNPSDLLAARHDGMTMKAYLAVPWPHPRYVKKHKAWKDEPHHLRATRAQHIIETTKFHGGSNEQR